MKVTLNNLELVESGLGDLLFSGYSKQPASNKSLYTKLLKVFAGSKVTTLKKYFAYTTEEINDIKAAIKKHPKEVMGMIVTQTNDVNFSEYFKFTFGTTQQAINRKELIAQQTAWSEDEDDSYSDYDGDDEDYDDEDYDGYSDYDGDDEIEDDVDVDDEISNAQQSTSVDNIIITDNSWSVTEGVIDGIGFKFDHVNGKLLELSDADGKVIYANRRVRKAYATEYNKERITQIENEINVYMITNFPSNVPNVQQVLAIINK